jgi:hypothetical protein
MESPIEGTLIDILSYSGTVRDGKDEMEKLRKRVLLLRVVLLSAAVGARHDIGVAVLDVAAAVERFFLMKALMTVLEIMLFMIFYFVLLAVDLLFILAAG